LREAEVLKERLIDAWYWLGRWGCRVFCLLFFRLLVYGRDNIPKKGPFILVVNHQSYLDPLFCGVPLQRRLFYVVRGSLLDNRLLGFLLPTIGTIPLRRDKANLAAMRNVIDRLKEGKGVCLFPEGTRTEDGKIAPLKSGFVLLCKRTAASIIPAAIDGAFECWPRHKKMFSCGLISVRYGKAITNEQIKNMSDKQLTKLLTDTMRQIQNDCRIKQAKKTLEYPY
jgi:1-acyl-sn-glycerol-3-phosphate acyltransferase